MATATQPATRSTAHVPRKPRLIFRELLAFAYDTFCTNKGRFLLTALSMMIGTASLILVVTIAMTGKQYVLNQIQAIGANMIYADYRGGAQRITAAAPDPLTMDDMHAVQEQVRSVVAASPVVTLNDRIDIGQGKQSDILVLGVSPEYRQVRNLVVLSGRFFDGPDSQIRNKVGLITDKLAQKVFGSPEAAVGKIIKLSGLPFTVIGTFREGVDTFGQSEVQEDTMLIPYTVSRYFIPTGAVHTLYFSVANPDDVGPSTIQIADVLKSRHRPESTYDVENLSQLVAVAGKSADALTAVLLLVALVVLLVSGIGIMNIMLATVSARTREVGIRKALGATNREIRFQFLAEAILISLIGGLFGVVIGLSIPLSVRYLTTYRIPISGLSAFVAIGVSSMVGILFGTAPAARAAKLDPVESLRYE